MSKKILLIPFLISVFCLTARSQEVVAASILPRPQGPYSIGTQKLFLTDSLRRETFVTRKKFREIYVKVWYPVVAGGNLAYERFLADYPTKEVARIFKEVGLNEELVAAIKQTATHSLTGNYELPAGEKFPVVIFNPGFYFGMADFYTSIIENLASNGFIVCSINHPYEQPYVEQADKAVRLKRKKAQLAYLQVFLVDRFKSFELETEAQVEYATRYYLKKLKRFDRTLRRWTADNEFFLDFLAKACGGGETSGIFAHMDLKNLGVMGHSLGGAVAGQVCLQNKDRLSAGINLDCFQFGDIIDTPLEVPFMLVESEHYHMWNLGNSVIFRNMASGFYKKTVKGARHFAFSDASILDLVGEAEKKKMIGNIDGQKTIEDVNGYILDFFDHYLRDGNASLIMTDMENETTKFKKY
ncbi:MAG: hypothetical protein QM786_11600 [Breznakibacter sp.]